MGLAAAHAQEEAEKQVGAEPEPGFVLAEKAAPSVAAFTPIYAGLPGRPVAPPPTGINRLLGATSGAYEGNVRAILAVMMAAAFVLMLAALLFLRVYKDAEYLQEIVVGGFGALVSAFTLTVGVYIGKRSADGA